MVDNGNTASNLRSAVITEPNLLPPPANLPPVGGMSNASADAILRTPYAGNVRALGPPPPPSLPQFSIQTNQLYGTSYPGAGYGGLGGAFGGFGNSFGAGGYSGYGSYGSYGGYNSYGGGAYNCYRGMNSNDPESRFIQLAEASSRPAFQSIESLVSAIGNIAAMLDSTFFALTSSFRAILGVAANFGRLRSVFAQFWSTFAIFRGLNWIYRKILYWLRISNLDPASSAFKRAFAEAVNEVQNPSAAAPPRKGHSPWPVMAFLSFIFTAPYLIMKLLGTVTTTAQEEARNPAKWISPIYTIAMYDFQARHQTELSLRAGKRVQIAPREIQQSLGLLNTGWALASIDGQQSGIIPITYVKSPQELRRSQMNEQASPKQQQPDVDITPQHDAAHSLNLTAAAFPAAPNDNASNFIQPIGPPSTEFAALEEGFA